MRVAGGLLGGGGGGGYDIYRKTWDLGVLNCRGNSEGWEGEGGGGGV